MLMIKELSFIQIGKWIVKYVYFMFIAPANLPTSLDLSSNKEFQNVSVFLLSIWYKWYKTFKSSKDSFYSWCIIASLTSVIRWHQWSDVPVTLVRSSSDFQIFNYYPNLQKASKLHLKFFKLQSNPC